MFLFSCIPSKALLHGQMLSDLEEEKCSMIDTLLFLFVKE